MGIHLRSAIDVAGRERMSRARYGKSSVLKTGADEAEGEWRQRVMSEGGANLPFEFIKLDPAAGIFIKGQI